MSNREPEVGNMLHMLPIKGDGFVLIVTDVDYADYGGIFCRGPIKQDGTWYPEEDEGERWDPDRDGDYIITDPARYDEIWADYCAWRLTGDSK